MTCELLRLKKFYTVDLSIPGVWVLTSDFSSQGNKGWVTKWRLLSQLLLILFWLLKACLYSNMWTSVTISARYSVFQLFVFLYFLFVFSKGSVKVDFRVIIIILAIDPENASAILDVKAITALQVVREAKTGSLNQLQVSKIVELLNSKYQLVTSTRNS